MHRLLVGWFSALILCLVVGTAAAATLAGVTMPDKIELGGHPLVLNGMGIRKATIFKVKVYVAGLYLETKSKNPEQILSSTRPKRLVMHFVRDVTHDEIADAWQEGVHKNVKNPAPVKARFAQLVASVGDIKKGDELSLEYLDGALSMRLNGALKVTIKGDDFARALFSIWLGSEPPNEDLKTGLLGK